MARKLATLSAVPHGKHILAGEPLVFHCNFYNYWLQKTLLLDEDLGMHDVIRDAAATSAYRAMTETARALGATAREEKVSIAQDLFAELGFGTIDLANVRPRESFVSVPVSHYGSCLRQAAGAEFGQPQTHFDAGFAAAATAFVLGEPLETYDGRIIECQSMGAAQGRIAVLAGAKARPPSPESLPTTDIVPPPPYAQTSVDEASILAALATLDFSGNEEGLIPRFGVMLTNHFANFYNRISFEFLRKMAGSGLVEAAEMLLSDAGYRCAFHTFGGIMQSAEWDAVVKPQLRSRVDWVHGMLACVNALGWGVWRVVEVSEDKLVVRIYDDYESCGWLSMYGRSDRPVCHLAQGGVAGVMNLVFLGDMASKPELDARFFEKLFEAPESFRATQTKSFAMGDPFTEIVATRGQR